LSATECTLLDHAEEIVQKAVKWEAVTKVGQVTTIKARQISRQGMILAAVLVQQMPRVVLKTTFLFKDIPL
jgi:hypothetical protein